MSLISRWFTTTLAYATDSQNTPEVDLLDSFEAIEIDIPTLSAAAEVQIKGSNTTGGTFDLIGLEEPISSSTGGFRTTVPLGGKYQFIKVYLSAAQTADRVFAVRGVSYASAGLVAVLDKIKQTLTETVLAAGSAVIGKVRMVTATGDEVTDDTADAVKSLLVDAAGVVIEKAEDAAHTSGDKGIMALSIRKDSEAEVAGTTEDYSPHQLDRTGNLRVVDSGKPQFGTPTLIAINNSRATWEKGKFDIPTWQKGTTGWVANLYGGLQTGYNDFAAVYVPVNELLVGDLTAAMWTWYQTAAESIGMNMVVWVHDPTDNDKRAELTQVNWTAGIDKSSGWNSHELNLATGQWTLSGEGTAGTGLSGDDNTWVEVAADTIISTWTIYRISFEWGYYTGNVVLQSAYVADIKINGIVIPLKPSVEEQLEIMRDDQAKALTTIPTWTFGEPSLSCAKNSIAYWSRYTTDPNYHPSGTQWKACLHGRVQTGNDWAALVIPVNEMPIPEFNTAYWQYVMASTQSMGVNIVFWCHDPDNFIYRAEITQDATDAGVTKTSGRNAHVFNPATTQMFYYGEITGTPDTCPTAGTSYTWAQFQSDSIFSRYTIYKITIEMGWQASGTFDHVWVGDLNLNGTNILLQPRSELDLAPVHTYYTGTSDITTGNGTVDPKTPFKLLAASLHIDVNPGEAAPFIIQVLRDNDKHATYYDTVIHTSDMYVPTDALSRHIIFGEGYEFAEDDVIDVLWDGNAKNYGLVLTWKPL